MATVPNAAIKKVIDNPRLIQQTEKQTHRIGCPYCLVGYVFVQAETYRWGKQQEVKVPKIHDPHKCEVCGKWVRLKMQMQIRALKMPEGGS